MLLKLIDGQMLRDLACVGNGGDSSRTGCLPVCFSACVEHCFQEAGALSMVGG